MSLKTILVCLTTPTSAEPLMKAAVALARQNDAHLIGLHTIEALIVYPGIAMHVDGEVFARFNANQKEQAEEVKAVFERHVAGETFMSEWRLLRTESTTAAERMVESARSVDLVILAQDDKGHDRPDQAHIQENVIRNSGRPVLVIPPDYDGAPIGRKIMVGWSATREAARAAHDVMDVAVPGAEVTLLKVGKLIGDELSDHAANALAANFDRHGFKPSVVHREKGGHDIAQLLVREAFEVDADLLATGAFGHSRVYDFVIGAATRDLLHTAPLPVLFSK